MGSKRERVQEEEEQAEDEEEEDVPEDERELGGKEQWRPEGRKKLFTG